LLKGRERRRGEGRKEGDRGREERGGGEGGGEEGGGGVGMRITSFTPHKLQTFRDSSHLKPFLLLLRA
jgi:hypothetical protein